MHRRHAAVAELTLVQATSIVNATLRVGRERGLSPLTVAVVDDGGNLKAFEREDGPGGAMRPQIAIAKAFGAIGMGISSRRLAEMALERPHFVNALVATSSGRLLPAPGGVIIKNQAGQMLGAIGVTGDSSDNDEAVAAAGIETVGLRSEI